MIARFLRSLSAPAAPVPAKMDGPLALAALMVRLAKADGHYSAAEAEGIEALLVARYQMTQDAAFRLRGEAENLEQDAADTVRFTRSLKAAVPMEARESVMQVLWSVVLSDGKRDENEDQLMRLCADLLGVSDRDSNLARQRAAAAT